MGFSLIPRDEGFFDLFDRQADKVAEVTAALHQMLSTFENPVETAGRIKKIESAADDITAEIYSALDRSFLTPLDPEDIHALAKCLDDVIDSAEDAAFRFSIYLRAPDKPTATAVKLAELIRDAGAQVAIAVKLMRNDRQGEAIMAAVREVASLENKGDHVYREAETALFAAPTDPIHLLKWNELYNELEAVLDDCREITNIVTEVILKSA